MLAYKWNTKKDTLTVYGSKESEREFDRTLLRPELDRGAFQVVLASLRPVKDTLPGMYGTFENLGLEFIAGALKQAGYRNIIVIDAHALDLSDNDVFERISQVDRIDFLGLSPSCETMRQTLELAERVKSDHSSIPIAMGGHHATLSAAPLLKNERSIDFVFLGEAEESVIELVDALWQKEQGAPEKKEIGAIAGVGSRGPNKEVVIGPQRALVTDIDSIGFPDRSTVDALRAQKADWARDARLLTSRGCQYGACSFCTTPSIYGNSWRGHSAKHVVDEIEHLHREKGVLFFWISDDQFISRNPAMRERAAAIAQEIASRGLEIYFRIMCRVDDFDIGSSEDRALIALLKQVGWRVALVGFEAGNDKLLREYKKGSSRERNLAFAKYLQDEGISIQSGFLMFDPNNSEDELRQNAEFLLMSDQGKFFGNFSRRIRVFYGTQNYYALRQGGHISDQFSYKTDSFDYVYDHPELVPFMDWINDVYFHVKEHDDTLWVIDNIYSTVFCERMARYADEVGDDECRERLAQFRELKSAVENEANLRNGRFFSEALDLHIAGVLTAQEKSERLGRLEAEMRSGSRRVHHQFTDLVGCYGEKVRYPFKHVDIVPRAYYGVGRGRF